MLSVNRTGFVLVGGKSSRMGRDKALLPLGKATLAQYVAHAVETAAGSVALVGDPDKYGILGYPVIPDVMTGRGPLGGILSALEATAADWNLILACDMPGIDTQFLSQLLERSEKSGADALLAQSPSGRPEPLCGAYHRRVAGPIRQALEANVRKVLDGLRGLRVATWRVPESVWLQNLNTPQEWAEYSAKLPTEPRP